MSAVPPARRRRPTTLAVVHEVSGPAGLVGDLFAERGHQLETVLVGVDPFPPPDGLEAVVVLGSSKSVHDDGDPHTRAELAYLAEVVDRHIPILGICFGAQALATVLGGRVAPSPQPEVGWFRVESDDQGLVDPGPWFQWHYDRIAVPPGARELARTEVNPQAFASGPHLGVQFHPEVTLGIVASWVAEVADEERAGLDAERVLADTRRLWAEGRARTERLVDGFLAGRHRA